jgi:tetratricopeptide (TPR) repeat protein
MRSLVFILLTALAAEGYSQAERKLIRQGNGSYKEGQYQQAEVEYRKALEKDPDSYRADYNLGNALYKQKQFDAAAGRYSSLAEKETDRKQLGRYLYNLGNTLYESKKYKESIEAYKMALRNNPGDLDAKHNLQLALRMLAEQQQQQNNQGKNQQQEEKNQQEQEQNQQEKEQQEEKRDQESEQQDQAQEQKEPQFQKGQISPEDAERILQALENEEKEVMKKVQERKEKVRKVPVDKNW